MISAIGLFLKDKAFGRPAILGVEGQTTEEASAVNPT